MKGGVSPETCWASYKYEIKFWYTVASCWISYVHYVPQGVWIRRKKLHVPYNFFGMDNWKIRPCPRHIGRRYRRRKCTAPFILNFDTRWRCVNGFTHRLRSPREGAPKTDWTGAWVGPRADLDALRRNLLPLTRTEPRFLGRTPRGGIAIATELSSNNTNRLTLASIRVGKKNPLNNKTTAFCPGTVSV